MTFRKRVSEARRNVMLDELCSELRVLLKDRNPSLEHVTRRVRRFIAEVSENQKAWLDGATVFDLNLAGRVATLLHDKGLKTVEAVLWFSAKELEEVPGIGPKVIAQVRAALKERNLALRGEVVSVFDLPPDNYPDPFDDED
jgi:DNA-directed RNA polymerase alpha subunit